MGQTNRDERLLPCPMRLCSHVPEPTSHLYGWSSSSYFPITTTIPISEQRFWSVECSHCGFHTPDLSREEAAIECWNEICEALAAYREKAQCKEPWKVVCPVCGHQRVISAVLADRRNRPMEATDETDKPQCGPEEGRPEV